MDLNICPDSIPSFLQFFDLSVAPPLLYYAYIPAILLSLFFGFFVFKKDKYSLQSKLLLGMALVFSVWVLNLIFQWIAVYIRFDMFSWQITPFIEIFIPILAIYFAFVFLNKKDISYISKIFFSVLILFTAVSLPTELNTLSFDFQNCQANYGKVYFYLVYVFELLAIFIIGYISLKKYFITPKSNQTARREALIFGLGSVIFLTIFYLSNILGEITKTYQINLFGPIGLIIFIVFMSFMIVRYGLFNIKLIGAQALVWALVILVGSEFFFVSGVANQILVGVTLVISAVLGLILVRSVKKEVKQREELQVANENQQLLIRFITHQVKGFFTKSKMIFSSILEGDIGEASVPVMDMMKVGLESDNKAVEMVQEVLKASSLRTGEMTYNFEDTNMVDFVRGIAEGFREMATGKNLAYEINLPAESTMVSIDRLQMTQVIKNLIDNSVKYTPTGKVMVNLRKKMSKINGNKKATPTALFSVEDTGLGLSDSDKAKLFTQGGRGEESLKVNVNSTGYGLFIVKKIVEGHDGKIWAESAGRGHGSRFYVELPIK